MGAYSMDMRVRVVRAAESGKHYKQIATELQVSERWVHKILKQKQDGKGLEPLYAGRCARPRKFTVQHEELLKQDVKLYPDSTLQERAERMQLPIKTKQLWYWLDRLEITHKKNAGRKRTGTR